jgi:predicted esterase
VLSAGSIEKSRSFSHSVPVSTSKAQQPRIYMIQGTSDETNPVSHGHQTRDFFLKYGYNVTYDEIQDLVHVFPFNRIETIMAWFESFQFRK